jgi:zinc protease
VRVLRAQGAALGLGLALGALAAPAQEGPASGQGRVPVRPEQLRFNDVPFEPPAAAPLRYELSNGVPVFVAEDHTVPLFSVSLALPVGDHDDPPDRVGLASLTAAMLRRAGAGELDADGFDEAADFLGLEVDSLAGATRSGVWLEGSPRALEEALDLLRDLVLAPRFEAGRVELALANLRGSLGTRNDDPLSVLEREWRSLLWGAADPRARVVLPRHLDAIDPAAMARFHRERWRARGAVFAVAGDVDARSVVAALERRFGRWPVGGGGFAEGGSRGDGSPGASASTRVGPASLGGADGAPDGEGGVWWIANRGPQGKLMLGHEGYRRASWDDPDAWALAVLAEVFGGPGAVSRVRSRLRAEEALVYRVRASFGVGVELPGAFEVFLEVDPGGAVAATRAVVSEIGRVRDEPVPEVELALAKRSLIDAFPLLFESPESVAGRFAEDALLGRPHRYWSIYRARIAAVSAADVRRVARRHLDPERLRLLWVGPQVDEKDWLSLGLGVVHAVALDSPAPAVPLGGLP